MESNLVLVPTTVSAGTNVKVLEAMAMQRAVVSTTSGCAGLGLLHGHSVWVADTPEAFAAGDRDADRRSRTPRADRARRLRGRALRNFDWAAIGEKQRALAHWPRMSLRVSNAASDFDLLGGLPPALFDRDGIDAQPE